MLHGVVDPDGSSQEGVGLIAAPRLDEPVAEFEQHRHELRVDPVGCVPPDRQRPVQDPLRGRSVSQPVLDAPEVDEGANYALLLVDGDYGLVDAGQIESCLDATVKTWSLHIGDSFTDVPRSSPFYEAIETLLHHGVAGATTRRPTARRPR